MSENNYLILPGCNDINRGDQALVWETVRIAKDAGFCGEYYMVTDGDDCIQSREKFKCIVPLLPHPSNHFKKGVDNKIYSVWLKMKWTGVTILDLMIALPLLCKPLRNLLHPLLPAEKKYSLECFYRCKVAFVKGGGFLHSYSGTSIDTYKIFFLLYHIILAQGMGIRVFVLPNSFGPLRGKIVKRMVRITLSNCELVTSRESISQKQLQKATCVNSILTRDLGFYLQKDDNYDALTELKAKGIPLGEKICVALTVRPYRFPGEPEAEDKYIRYKAALIEFVRLISKRGMYSVFIEHVYDRNLHENDMTCIFEIMKELEDVETCSVYSNRQLNCQQLMKVYSCFDYTVGTRFHSVVFSMASGVPSIAITYGGNKGRGIMKDLGFEKYAISMSNISGDTLTKMFEELLRNTDDVKSTLRIIQNENMNYRNELKKILRRKRENIKTT